jgi:tripartite-type tricarboxylate transporter receptor subunit TctC
MTTASTKILACEMCCLAAAVLLSQPGAAQDTPAFPARNVQIVVPYAPGTTPDALARILAPRLAEQLKVGVIVDNRPGATGSIGMTYVARAAADGHTLMFVPSSFAMIPALYTKLPFDPVRSFAPVTLLATSGLVLVVHPGLPSTSAREFVQLAKRRPGELLYSSPGNGSAQHLAMELFKLETGVNVIHVPHKAFATALADLTGGHVQSMISSLQTVHAHVLAGRLRALAVLSAARELVFPDTPTLKETGVARLEIDSWYGALAPAGTPRNTISRVNAEIATALRHPDVRDQLANQGMDVAQGSPEQFGALLQTELARWSRVVTAAKIKPD